MGKSTISMVIFNSYVTNYQKVNHNDVALHFIPMVVPTLQIALLSHQQQKIIAHPEALIQRAEALDDDKLKEKEALTQQAPNRASGKQLDARKGLC